MANLGTHERPRKLNWRSKRARGTHDTISVRQGQIAEERKIHSEREREVAAIKEELRGGDLSPKRRARLEGRLLQLKKERF